MPLPRQSLSAFRVLTMLQFGSYPYLEVMPRGILMLHSIRKLARTLGMTSRRMNIHLKYLEHLGFLESLTYSPNRRACTFRLRSPSNV